MSGLSQDLVVDVVIPARDAAGTLREVIEEIPSRQRRSVVVVDYGSSDATAHVAMDAGAVVLRLSRGGYGAACRRGVDHLAALPRPSDVVVFLSADGSDDPAEIEKLVAPIAAGDAELVIGRRDAREPSLRRAVAVRLIRTIYGHPFEAVSPFRAIRLPALVALGLWDGGSGYDIEMLVKAVRLGLHILEVPVSYREPGRAAAPLAARMRAGVGSTTKVLFHIFRNATAR